MTVDEEFQERNASYIEKLHEDLAFEEAMEEAELFGDEE